MKTLASIPRLILIATVVAAQAAGVGHAAVLSEENRTEVVDGLIELLLDVYVIPETAEEISARLRSEIEAGSFDAETDPAHFAQMLTTILQEMSGDQHLRVSVPGAAARDHGGGGPRVVRKAPGDAASGTPEGGQPVRVVRRAGGPETKGGGAPSGGEPSESRGGPGGGAVPRGLDQIEPFPGVEMLAGNVGLVEVRLFAPREIAEAKAVAAMETVAGADALIFDLRGCMGGAPDMVHLITSYLYPPEPMHLLTYYHGHTEPDSAYTLAEIPGERMQDVPVYVLTSAFTASGGEEFSYNLKHHGRATLVGEVTAGAGHGGGVHALPAGFEVFMPDFRPVHPKTGGGWEGVGVRPDVEAPAEKALAVAHREALREIGRLHPDRSRDLAPEIAKLEAEIEREPAPFDRAAHLEYAGQYEIRTIRVKDDGLYIQRTGGPELLLVAGSEADTFTLQLVPSAKLRFERDDEGAISALHVRNLHGEWEVSARTPMAQ